MNYFVKINELIDELKNDDYLMNEFYIQFSDAIFNTGGNYEYSVERHVLDDMCADDETGVINFIKYLFVTYDEETYLELKTVFMTYKLHNEIYDSINKFEKNNEDNLDLISDSIFEALYDSRESRSFDLWEKLLSQKELVRIQLNGTIKS